MSPIPVNPQQAGEQKTSVFLGSSYLSSSILTCQQIQGAPSKPRPPSDYFSTWGIAGTLAEPGHPPSGQPRPPFSIPRQGHLSESASDHVSLDRNLAGPFSPRIQATCPTPATSPGDPPCGLCDPFATLHRPQGHLVRWMWP